MNADIANIVDRILLCGLDLKERLEKGEKLDLALEQPQLRTLLKTENEARRWPDYGGDHPVGGSTIGGERTHSFLGVRYALACWLDELFINGSPWESVWVEQLLEYELYRSRLRAEQFWEQARRAEARPHSDALEAYYLCAMLGFRGSRAGEPAKLQAWCDAVEPRITTGYDRGYELPAEKAPPCNVPPLTGQDTLRKIALLGGTLVAVLLLLTSFVLVRLSW